MPPSSPNTRRRIACVQYGDYVKALAARQSGQPETYQGQFYTVDAYERFIAGHDHLVIGIGPAPAELRRDAGTVLTMERPRARWLPGRARDALLWHRIRSQLTAFRPTHLLVRVNDRLGVRLLETAAAQQLPTACIIASTFAPTPVNLAFCRLASGRHVEFVANHLRVARQSLVDCGLPVDKALAYDYPVVIHPKDHAPKRLAAAGRRSLVYAGVLSVDKGVRDLLQAFERLRESGLDVALTVCGDGELRGELDAAAARHPTLDVRGRVAHDEVVRLMRAADLVVVPSRSTFAEGLPLTLLESLAVRTPVVASNHPVFRRYFVEGQGVILFPEADPTALADTVTRLLSDPDRYAAVSEAGASAWQSVQEPLLFDDLLQRLKSSWQL
jgi:glycosyltransferase involved in cell wall biosynthesis